jgi:hypothetical protein
MPSRAALASGNTLLEAKRDELPAADTRLNVRKDKEARSISEANKQNNFLPVARPRSNSDRIGGSGSESEIRISDSEFCVDIEEK